jgi:phosphate transport system substrate-binding protein
MLRLRSATVAAAVGLTLVPAAAEARTTITMSGSTSIAPLASQLARGYIRTHRNPPAFRLNQGGSDIGIADVARGRVSIGNSSRDPQPSDPGGLVFKRIARDGVCIITNPRNRVGNMSQQQVQAIFTGRVRSWSQIPGASYRGSIQLFVRTAASGTQDAFQNIFLGQNLRVAGSAQQRGSNGLVQSSVASSANPGAIGYVSFDFTRGTNRVAYRGVQCTLRNAKAGTYGGTRNFWMVTRGQPRGAVASFIRWIQSSAAAARITASNWVPLR